MAKNEIEPNEAIELFIADKKADDVAARTIQSYRDQLRRFVEWLRDGASGSYETISDVDGLTLKEYKRDHAEHAQSTLHNVLRTVREMLRWAASVNAHDIATVEAIELKRPQDVRNGEVTAEEAGLILEKLDKYHYASRDHVACLLLWECGCRLGTLRAFDVGDFDREEAFVEAVHRPESDTPLKNNDDGQRPIALAPEVCQIVQDYIDTNRRDVTDEYGREPLLTTEQGRPALITLRVALWALTRPCWYGKECPDGKEPEECEAAGPKRNANDCPHNNSPHDVRRGRLTHYRRSDKPKHVISDRCDVSVQILEEHYNEMTEKEKMEQRRDYL